MDNYGEFDLPEEKSEIEVIEDPVKAVISSYEFFRKIANEKINLKNYSLFEFVEELYERAEKTLEGKEKLAFDENKIEKIVQNMTYFFAEEKWIAIPGLFLSALQNKTTIDTLILRGDQIRAELAGYKLKKDKTLVIGKKVRTKMAGYLAEGNIINNGEAEQLSQNALGGFYINNGTADYFGMHAKKGVYINNGNVQTMGWGAGFDDEEERINVININTGIVKLQMATYPDYTINISTGQIERHIYKRNIILINYCSSTPLKQKLDDKLSEIEFTKTLDELPYEEQIRKVKEFDWQKFEKETTEIAEEIQEAHRKEYK